MKLLVKIVELVDRDVAANSKPISIVGMAIPFLPFMVFVDGAPADKYPVLASLALALSIGWGLFVGWRVMRHLGIEMKSYSATLGSVRAWIILICTILLILLLAGGEMWLSEKIGWPELYGFECHGRGCMLQDLVNSPQLLTGGSVYELSLFALLWLFPVSLVFIAIYALLRRRRQNRIEPMD